MDITVAKAVTEQALSTIDGALENKPTGLSRLLLAYSPELVRKFLHKGRVRLIHLRHHEELLENTFKLIQKTKNELIEKSKGNGLDPLLRLQLEQLEREYRILSTVKLALPYITDKDDYDSREHEDEGSETESLWWDLFEDLASRRNEQWRVELFARSIALNDEEPGSIPLKPLWEISMMEADDFGVLKLFLDSSLYVDGKPIILIEPEEQYTFEPDVNEFQSGNLALCISSLIDKGLVQKAATQFMTTEPVELRHASGTTYLFHQLEDHPINTETAIRIDGYSPTDHCLDISRLYTPTQNIASDRSMTLLKEVLEESMGEVDSNEPKSNYDFVVDAKNKC